MTHALAMDRRRNLLHMLHMVLDVLFVSKKRCLTSQSQEFVLIFWKIIDGLTDWQR